jgi:chromosome segregation ATPase
MIDQGAKLESELERLEIEHTQLHAQQTAVHEIIQERTAQVSDLEAEIAQLQMQAAHLERNITGLKELREQNLLSVMDLTSELHDVSSGKD